MCVLCVLLLWYLRNDCPTRRFHLDLWSVLNGVFMQGMGGGHRIAAFPLSCTCSWFTSPGTPATVSPYLAHHIVSVPVSICILQTDWQEGSVHIMCGILGVIYQNIWRYSRAWWGQEAVGGGEFACPYIKCVMWAGVETKRHRLLPPWEEVP